MKDLPIFLGRGPVENRVEKKSNKNSHSGLVKEFRVVGDNLENQTRMETLKQNRN